MSNASTFNAYQTPLTQSTPQVEKDSGMTMGETIVSLGIMFLGFILFLPGYMGSTLVLIGDLYGNSADGFGLQAIIGQEFNPWLGYAFCTTFFVLGTLLIGSQRFMAITAVAYVICPIVAIAALLGAPLRGRASWNRTAAIIYAVGGAIIAGVAMWMMLQMLGKEFTLETFGASIAFQLGIAATIGGLLYLALVKTEDSVFA